MKRIAAILLLFMFFPMAFSQIAIDSIWSDEVKSVFLTRNDIEMERPFIRLGELGEPTEQLMLRFDILWPQPYNLRYRISHCNARWERDNLDPSEFISGIHEGEIENYQSSFTTLRDYINYYQPIPNAYSQFIASGNYILEIFPSEHPDSILITRRFCVYEDLTSIKLSIDKPSGSKGDFNRDQEVSLSVTPRDGSFLPLQADFYRVEVQQNRRTDLKRAMPFNSYSGNSMLYRWSVANVFPGGNCFRYFDLSNTMSAMYHIQRIEQWGGETFAFLQPEEDRSQSAYSQYSSLNGGMKINVRERQNPQIEADYVWVNFSLPMAKPFLNGSIHIVGDITDWQLNDASRMEWNPKYRAYTKRMLLKQGYYAYQLLFLPTGETEGLTSTLEGDHFVMQNNYTVYVYFIQPGSRYDRLVGLNEFLRQ